MTTQSTPGTLSLANALASGISAQTVALAEQGKAANAMGSNMSGYAQKTVEEGAKMASILSVMEGIQIATIAVGGLTGLAGAGVAFGADADTAPLIEAAVNGAVQGGQGLVGLAQGSAQLAKSDVQSSIQIDNLATTTLGQVSQTQAKSEKNLSQGASATGSAINAMTQSMGSVMGHRFIRS